MAIFPTLSFGILAFFTFCFYSITSAEPITHLINNKTMTLLEERAAEMLIKRAHGDENDPIEAFFDITGWEGIAEENCRIMLCLLNGNRKFQKVSTQAEERRHYRESGASLHPFFEWNTDMRGTRQINSRTTSAEDFPWRSIHLPDNARRYVCPAILRQNSVQGSAITQGYQHSGVGYSQWFTINFTGTLGQYCAALFNNPPDTSLCGKDEPLISIFEEPNIKLSDYIFYKDGFDGRTIKFSLAGSTT